MSGPATLSLLTGVLLDAGLKATPWLLLGELGARLTRSPGQAHAVRAATLLTLPALLPAIAWSQGAALPVDTPWLLVAWAIGCVSLMARQAFGVWSLHRLARHARPDPDHGIRVGTSPIGPVTFGAFRPTVLMPQAAEAWPADWRHAAWAHEHAHIRRQDWLVHTLSWLTVCLFWFHPLVWVVRRRLTQDAERAVDAMVLGSGVLPSTYASLLLSLAQQRGAGLAAAQGDVSGRIRAVLASTPPGTTRRWPLVAGMVGVACLLGMPLAALPVWTSSAPLTCQPEPGLLP